MTSYSYVNDYGKVKVDAKNLVTNGGFDTDTDWVTNGGFSIVGGVASCDGTIGTSDVAQEGIVEASKSYRLKYTVSSYVSGTIRARSASSNYVGITRDSNGTFSEIITPETTASGYLTLQGTDFNGSIDNVSVVEVTNKVTPKLQKGLILDMPLQEPYTKASNTVVQDRTPYGNNGDVNGAIVGSNSTEFDGTDDYIDLGADKPTDLTGDLTISAWINPESIGETSGKVINNYNISLEIWKDKMTLSSNGSTLAQSNTITYGEWINVIVTRESDGTANFYIDNTLSGDADQTSGTPVAGTTNTFIGNRDAGDRTFDGQISNLKIFNRVLSADEIDYLYNKEKVNYK